MINEKIHSVKLNDCNQLTNKIDVEVNAGVNNRVFLKVSLTTSFAE
jgi:hypothetical protein